MVHSGWPIRGSLQSYPIDQSIDRSETRFSAQNKHPRRCGALLEAITPSADSLWKRGLHPFGTRGGCAGLSRSPGARSWRQRAPGPLGCGQVNRDRTATPGLGRAHPLPFSSNPPAVPKTKSELSSVCSRWDLSPIWRGFRRNSVWGNFVNNSVWWGGGGVEGTLPPLGRVRGG